MTSAHEYMDLIKPVWDRLQFEASIAPGETITLRHLALATLVQPEVATDLAGLHLPPESDLRLALTRGSLAAPAGQHGRLVALPPKSLTDSPQIQECLTLAMRVANDQLVQRYFRLLDCALRGDPEIDENLATIGVDVPTLHAWIDLILGSPV